LRIAVKVFLDARRLALLEAIFQLDVDEFDEDRREGGAGRQENFKGRSLSAIEGGLKGFDAAIDFSRIGRAVAIHR
jgi:hypothetical protein